MLTLTRDTKRLTIIAIYLLSTLVIATGLYFLFRPAPTCFDAKQNQNETGVDCGGVCAMACMEKLVGADVLVREITFIPTDTNLYDIVARVFNPNNDLGAASFSYVLSLRDANGIELARSEGKSFLLPQDTKTLLAFNIETTTPATKAVIELSNFDWQRLKDYQEKPELNIYEKRYTEVSSGIGFGEATGILTNESLFDFRSLYVKVVLRDANGVPLAANQTEMRTVTVGEQRSFRLLWPAQFPGVVARADMEVDADVFSSENFLERYEVKKRALPVEETEL